MATIETWATAAVTAEEALSGSSYTGPGTANPVVRSSEALDVLPALGMPPVGPDGEKLTLPSVGVHDGLIPLRTIRVAVDGPDRQAWGFPFTLGPLLALPNHLGDEADRLRGGGDVVGEVAHEQTVQAMVSIPEKRHEAVGWEVRLEVDRATARMPSNHLEDLLPGLTVTALEITRPT